MATKKYSGGYNSIHSPSAKKNSIKKNNVRRNNSRAITIMIFIFLTIYLLGYLIVFASKPSIAVETVTYGTIDVPATLKGIIIRDEYVVKSTMAGMPEYNYSENDRVKKNTAICSIKNVQNTDILEGQLAKIDKDMFKTQRERSDISIFQEDITRIEKNISEAVNAYIYKFINGNISEVYSLKNQVDTQVNQRNSIWLAENTKSLSEMNTQKSIYKVQLDENKQSLYAYDSGILSLRIDGMEEILTPETIGSVSEEQTKMGIKPEIISKTQSVNIDSPVFKIIRSNIWYLVSYIPNNLAQSWTMGQTKTISTSVNDEELNVDMVIKELETGEKNTRVIFSSNKNMLDFIDLRNFDFKISDDINRGLKIPNNAIIEKTLLKVPGECIVENMDKQGVIKKEATGENFIELNISKKEKRDETGASYDVYILQDFGTLKLGDTIKKAGDTQETYQINDVSTYKGVFVVNTSIADFKIVDVLAENKDYSIVKSDTVSGLRVYDNIVSDARNIEDNDEIY